MEQLFLIFYLCVRLGARPAAAGRLFFGRVRAQPPFRWVSAGRGLLLFCAQVACVFAAETLLNWMLFLPVALFVLFVGDQLSSGAPGRESPCMRRSSAATASKAASSSPPPCSSPRSRRQELGTQMNAPACVCGRGFECLCAGGGRAHRPPLRRAHPHLFRPRLRQHPRHLRRPRPSPRRRRRLRGRRRRRRDRRPCATRWRPARASV